MVEVLLLMSVVYAMVMELLINVMMDHMNVIWMIVQMIMVNAILRFVYL